MKDSHIVSIGEVLWDIMPSGKKLGGAPANFVFHTQNLGVSSIIISAIGDDLSGKEIKQTLQNKEVPYLFNLSENPTGTVTVKLNNGSPSYTIHENVAWDKIILNNEAKNIIKKAKAICFGSLAQRSTTSRNTIRNAIKLAPRDSLKIFDINLRQHYYSKKLIQESLQLTNIFKLNIDELEILKKFFNLDSCNKTASSQLLNQFDLKLLALSNGGVDSMLITKKCTSILPSPKVKIVDTVGAGDSFMATIVVGLLQNKPLKEIHQKAIDYSAKVCMHKGATPKIEFI